MQAYMEWLCSWDTFHGTELIFPTGIIQQAMQKVFGYKTAISSVVVLSQSDFSCYDVIAKSVSAHFIKK